MQTSQAARWGLLLFRCFISGAGTYLSTLAAHAHGALLWLPVAIAAGTVFEAGLSKSPGASEVAPVQVVNADNQPVPVQPAGVDHGE